jgi:hypothetical protein
MTDPTSAGAGACGARRRRRWRCRLIAANCEYREDLALARRGRRSRRWRWTWCRSSRGRPLPRPRGSCRRVCCSCCFRARWVGSALYFAVKNVILQPTFFCFAVATSFGSHIVVLQSKHQSIDYSQCGPCNVSSMMTPPGSARGFSPTPFPPLRAEAAAVAPAQRRHATLPPHRSGASCILKEQILQILKPGFHSIEARVLETRRLSGMGQGQSTCTAPTARR